MQTITLIALGKLNADYYAKAAAEYAKRLSAYCRLNIVELPEEPIAEKNASPAVIGKALEKEARAILTAVPKGSSLAALCVEGKQKTSEELAAYLDERAGSGAGRLLAGTMQEALITALSPQKERAAMPGDYFILQLDTPSVLVECGFISNPAEEALLLSPAYQEKLGEAIADGAAEYFRLAQAEK